MKEVNKVKDVSLLLSYINNESLESYNKHKNEIFKFNRVKNKKHIYYEDMIKIQKNLNYINIFKFDDVNIFKEGLQYICKEYAIELDYIKNIIKNKRLHRHVNLPLKSCYVKRNGKYIDNMPIVSQSYVFDYLSQIPKIVHVTSNEHRNVKYSILPSSMIYMKNYLFLKRFLKMNFKNMNIYYQNIMKKIKHFAHKMKMYDNIKMTSDDIIKLMLKLKKICDVVAMFVDGVAGMGKSYAIEKCVSQDMMDNKKFLILTPSKSSKETFTKKFVGSDKYIRTVDSIMINGKKNVDTVDTIYFDEATMTQLWIVYYVMYIYKCNKIFIFGDKKQIPFVSRIPGFVLKYPMLKSFYRINVITSYRYGANTCKILKKMGIYDNVLSNKFGDVFEAKLVNTIEDFHYDRYTLVTCYLQSTKKILKSLFKKRSINVPVMTIHEAEGKSTLRHCFVRGRVQNTVIYNDKAYWCVGCTRHIQKFTYLTVCPKDTLLRKIRGAMINKTFKTDFSAINKKNTIMYKKSILSFGNCYRKKRLIQENDHEKLIDNINVNKSMVNFLDNVIGIKSYLRRNYFFYIYPLQHKYMLKSSSRYWTVLDVKNIINSIMDLPPKHMEEKLIYSKKNDDMSYMVMKNGKGLANRYKNYKNIVNWKNMFLKPKLHTGMTKNCTRDDTVKQYSIKVRNINPTKVDNIVANQMIDNVVSKTLNFFCRKKLKKFLSTNSPKNIYMYSDWYRSLSGGKKKSISALIDNKLKINKRNKKFTMMLKGMLKPNLKNTYGYKMPAGQIITVPMEQLLNAFYSGTFNFLTKLMKTCLKDKYIVFTGRDDYYYEQWLSDKLKNQSNLISRELDIEKYDKSQNDFCLKVSIKMMTNLGLGNEILEFWEDSHTVNIIKDIKQGSKFKTYFQRRSGEQATYILNTLVGMMAFATQFDLNNKGLVCIAFNGDDNVAYYKDNTALSNNVMDYELLFNLQLKIDDYVGSSYFSSRFIVPHMGSVLYIPDPLKLLIKLGRDDLTCKEHIIEYHRSIKDLYHRYGSHEVRKSVLQSLYNRYVVYYPRITKVLLYKLMQFIGDLSRNVNLLLSLYHYDEKLWNKKMQITLKNKISNEYRYSNYLLSVENALDFLQF